MVELVQRRIKRIRLSKGMSLPAFAKACDVSYTAARNWEVNGTATAFRPKPESLVAAAKALGVTVSELVNGETSPEQTSPATEQFGGAASISLAKRLKDRLREVTAELNGVKPDQVEVHIELR
jgi:transcriptional regulator with XRE-family HTH domain